MNQSTNQHNQPRPIIEQHVTGDRITPIKIQRTPFRFLFTLRKELLREHRKKSLTYVPNYDGDVISISVYS